MSMDGDPIRVLFCHFTADVSGGSDRSLFDLVTHLPRGEFAPVVALKTGDPLAARYREANVPVHELALVPPRRALEPIKLLRYMVSFPPSVLRLCRIIQRERIALVHVNTLYNLQGAMAARIMRRPLVWHVRELPAASGLARIFHACARRWAARVIANSRAVGETAAACGERLSVVYNGIDLSEYEHPADGAAVRREFRVPDDAPVIAVIGRIEPWKGQRVAAEAMPEILARFPDARLWIVGGPAVNKPEYLRGIKERVRELGIENRICFTGIRGDIPSVLAACTVLVLPSVTPEPFGRTIVEARAAGKPVIATNHGGPVEILRNGETGLLVPPGDPSALARAVLELLEHPARAAQLGQAGRADAFARFSLDRLVRDMARILTEVYSTTGRSPRNNGIK